MICLRENLHLVIWAYKLKYLADGTAERYKSRSVVLENHQEKKKEFQKTFAPLAKLTIVIYMKFPLVFRILIRQRCVAYTRFSYGLRQAPWSWFKKLVKAGFIHSYAYYYSRGDRC